MQEGRGMTLYGMVQAVFGEHTANALAGGAGGLVRALALGLGVRQGAVSLIVGALCSIYAAPAAAPLFKWVSENQQARDGFTGFAIGIGGMIFAGLILDVWSARREQIRKESQGGSP
ncbi:MAG TPA: hypothetical protein PK954_10330 [Anaerolineales bacterium]|nr:hypothetical protein [Anaerolineales bacterium]